MAATLCILVLMVLAASCLYEAFVYLAVKQKSTFVGRKTKDKVLAMAVRPVKARPPCSSFSPSSASF